MDTQFFESFARSTRELWTHGKGRGLFLPAHRLEEARQVFQQGSLGQVPWLSPARTAWELGVFEPFWSLLNLFKERASRPGRSWAEILSLRPWSRRAVQTALYGLEARPPIHEEDPIPEESAYHFEETVRCLIAWLNEWGKAAGPCVIEMPLSGLWGASARRVLEQWMPVLEAPLLLLLPCGQPRDSADQWPWDAVWSRTLLLFNRTSGETEKTLASNRDYDDPAYLYAQAHQALFAGALAEALKFLNRLDSSTHSEDPVFWREVLILRAETLSLAGDARGALESAREAWSILHPQGFAQEKLPLLRLQARLHRRRKEYSSAEASLKQAEPLLDSQSPLDCARHYWECWQIHREGPPQKDLLLKTSECLQTLGWLHHLALLWGDSSWLRQFGPSGLLRGLKLARRQGNQYREACLLEAHAEWFEGQGELRQAAGRWLRASKIWEALGEYENSLLCKNRLIEQDLSTDRIARAKRLLGQGLRNVQDRPYLKALSELLYLAGLYELLTGSPDRALVFLEPGLNLGRQNSVGSAVPEVRFHALLALALRAAGRFQQAEEQLALILRPAADPKTEELLEKYLTEEPVKPPLAPRSAGLPKPDLEYAYLWLKQQAQMRQLQQQRERVELQARLQRACPPEVPALGPDVRRWRFMIEAGLGFHLSGLWFRPPEGSGDSWAGDTLTWAPGLTWIEPEAEPTLHEAPWQESPWRHEGADASQKVVWTGLVTAQGSRLWFLFHPLEGVSPRELWSDLLFPALRQLLESLESAWLWDRLQIAASFDTLTGLYNRRLIHKKLRESLGSRHLKHQGWVALLYLDLDHFKSVNDQLGHDSGDRLLTWFADALRKQIRAGDSAGRLGGDEFLIVLPGEREEGAIGLAQRILDQLQNVPEEWRQLPEDQRLGCSIGIVTFHKDSPEGWDVWLRRADEALYRSKMAGRNRYMVFNP